MSVTFFCVAHQTLMRQDHKLVLIGGNVRKMLRPSATATVMFGLLHAYASSAVSRAQPKPPPNTAPVITTAAAQEQVSPEEANNRKDWSQSMLKKSAPKQ